MKKRLLAYSSITLAAAALLLGVNYVSAHGFYGFFGGSTATPEQIASRQQTAFQNEAALLGISVDEVKNAWAEGKTLQQLAQDHGITADQLQQKLKDYSLQQIKDQLQTLVSQGVITQAQADQRLQFIQNNQNKTGKMGHRGGGMMGFYRGMGW